MPWLLWWLAPLTVVLAIMTLRLVLWRRWRARGWHHLSLTLSEILSRRLASGDLTVQEYRQLRQTLAQEP